MFVHILFLRFNPKLSKCFYFKLTMSDLMQMHYIADFK
jgi:hypothetical protein